MYRSVTSTALRSRSVTVLSRTLSSWSICSSASVFCQSPPLQQRSNEVRPLYSRQWRACEWNVRSMASSAPKTDFILQRAREQQKIATEYTQKEDWSKALEGFEKAVALNRQHAKESKLDEKETAKLLAEPLFHEGFALQMDGQAEVAVVRYDEAIEYFEAISSPPRSIFGQLLMNRAELAAAEDDLEYAVKCGERATALISEEYGTESDFATAAAHNLACYYGASGDHAKANDMMRDALDKLSRLYGPSNAFTVTVATSLYRSLLHLEKIEEAEALKEKYSKLGHALDEEPEEPSEEMVTKFKEEQKKTDANSTLDPEGFTLSMNQVTDEFKSFAKTWQKQGLPLDGDYLDSVMKEIQKDGEEGRDKYFGDGNTKPRMSQEEMVEDFKKKNEELMNVFKQEIQQAHKEMQEEEAKKKTEERQRESAKKGSEEMQEGATKEGAAAKE